MMLRRLKSVSKCFKNIFRGYQECFKVVKLRLGALIPRSLCLSVVCCTVCPPKITKNYKTLQNLSKHYKTLKDAKTRIFFAPRPLHVGRPSRKLRQHAGASLTKSSFLGCNEETKYDRMGKRNKECRRNH